MGVVEKVEKKDFVVKDMEGRLVSIRMTADTQYFVEKRKASADDLEVGRRIAVDVSGMKGDYSALEVRLGVEEPVAAAASEDNWTCSMHPEIRVAEPGRCPVCNMTLVPGDDQKHDSGAGKMGEERLGGSDEAHSEHQAHDH